jgi:nonsense-mediated mRNA decay protein 3
MKFCFVCGKRTEKLVKGYCEDCYNKNFSLIGVPQELSITQCSKCKKIKHMSEWVNEIETVIRDKIKVLGEDVNIIVKNNEIFVTGSLKGSKNIKKEVHKINIKIIKTVCEECSRRYGGYYEAILQLRGNISNEILSFIDKEVNKKSFYRAESVKDGLNLYVGNKGVAEQVADTLSKKYKFKIKKSYKLFTKKEGRDVYRSIIFVNCD